LIAVARIEEIESGVAQGKGATTVNGSIDFAIVIICARVNDRRIAARIGQLNSAENG
jgi:hypothetical protein